MPTFYYRAFGLAIESDGAVVGLPTASAPAAPDLRLHMGALPDGIDSARGEWHEVWRSMPSPGEEQDAVALYAPADDSRYLLVYADGTRFLIAGDGSEIWATWLADASAEAAGTYLLGPVVGFALRLRGLVCLHASSVVIGQRALLLTGPAGSGKSSTAAALALRGRRVLGDDIAVVEQRDTQWMVRSAIPGVRLWDDMVTTLLGRPDALPLLAPGWEKRQLDLRASPAGFLADETVPLGAIYLLSPLSPSRADTAAGAPSPSPADSVAGAHPPSSADTAVGAQRLHGRNALLPLIANSYANVLLTATLRRAEFLALSSIVRHIPVWRVDVSDDVRGLANLCDRIEGADPARAFAPGVP